MPVYSYGRKIGEIYVDGVSIGKGYSGGRLVFQKGGWAQDADFTMTVTAAAGASINGTVTFNTFVNKESGNIVDRYYKVASTNLYNDAVGVVYLMLSANSAISFQGNEEVFYTSSSGTFKLSYSELKNLHTIKSIAERNPVVVPASCTSYYIEPNWDLSVTQQNTSTIYLNPGWTIAVNRTSRMAISGGITKTLSELGISGTGKFPVYGVAASAVEGTISNLTSSIDAHNTYDDQLLKHLAWITVQDGVVTSIESLHQNTGAQFGRSLNGNILSVVAGWGTDTDGIRVQIPGFNYDIQWMINAANDSQQPGTRSLIHTTNCHEEYGVFVIDKLVNKTNYYVASNLWQYTISLDSNISGPGTIEAFVLTYSYDGVQSTSSWSVVNTEDVAIGTNIPGSDIMQGQYYRRQMQAWSVPSGQLVDTVRWYAQLRSDSTGYYVYKGSGSCGIGNYVYYTPTIVVPGSTQVLTLYACVTRNADNGSMSVTQQGTSGDSSPFISYVYIGTITVQRNTNYGVLT